MKRTINSLIMAGTVVLSACQTQKSDTGEIIGKSSPKIENGIIRACYKRPVPTEKIQQAVMALFQIDAHKIRIMKMK